MKKYIQEFLRRGIAACGLGPLVLAVLYLILGNRGVMESLTVREVAVGIFSLSALAFVAGGMNVVYQLERMPLMQAVLIHGLVLYFCYLATYLVNGWLERGILPMLVFSLIFVLGYVVIWAVIYATIKRNTDSINEKLREKQRKDPLP